MKYERNVFLFLMIFFIMVTPIYGFVTKEVVGIFVLGLTAVLFVLIVGYLFIIGRKIDNRPEDDPHGEIYQGAGELGFFPPQSIWPFWCALALTVFLLGPVFGAWWLSILGFGMGLWAVAGWVFEFYRGEYAH